MYTTLSAILGAFSRPGQHFVSSVLDNVTAVNPGAIATAALLTSDINRVVTVAAGGSGVKLPAAVPGLRITVVNAHASNAINVYPQSTPADVIDALGAGTAYSLAATKSAVFLCTVALAWNALVGA